MVRATSAASIATSWDTGLALATTYAPYLRALLAHTRIDLAALKQHGPESAMNQTLAQLALLVPERMETAVLMAVLRQAKSDVALITALADLGGIWSLELVTRALSDFADAAISLALRHALSRQPGTARKPKHVLPLSCLALGKLGGRELNYSSDIDLIFLFDETLIGAEDEPSLRLGRCVHALARILQEPTEDGYVFRVDLRLRPDPGATPPALSMAAAEIYYQSAALTWERAAYTRARVCAGNMVAGNAFLQRLSGWIWRRNLDFSAIRDIDALREQILDHYDLATFSAAGYDVKRGIGGIREIEFAVQILQLIHGGRRPDIRTAHTPDGLAKLSVAGLLPAADAQTLGQHYAWLRMVEHRLQMQHDQQTHMLPNKSAERSDVAQFCGYPSLDAFEAVLAHNIAEVHAIYERLLGKKSSVAFVAPVPRAIANSAAIFARWEAGRYRALAHPRARSALENIKPALLAVFSTAADPSAALARWDTLLSHLPAGVVFLEMFEANPKLLQLIAQILSVSDGIGAQLAQQPHLLDAVLEHEFFAPLSQPLVFPQRADSDTQSRLNRLARWVAEQRFREAVHVLQNISSPAEAARAHARLMDITVEIVARLAETEISASHGTIADADFAVVALGAWGGGMLGPGSDLDCLFIFQGDEALQSRGNKSLSATHYFNRLGQRFIALMTAATPFGRLAEIDMRLRPSGNKGLLVVSTDGFQRYQQESAWTWEHMALTRARCVYGRGGPLAALIAGVLQLPRDLLQLRADVIAMRADMDRHRPPAGIWDMKLQPGGLIDIEFIVQYLQLIHGAAQPDILVPDIALACTRLVACGIVSDAQGSCLLQVWHNQFGVRCLLKLCAAGDATQSLTPAAARLIAQLTHHPTLAKSVQSIRQERKAIIKLWRQIFKSDRFELEKEQPE